MISSVRQGTAAGQASSNRHHKKMGTVLRPASACCDMLLRETENRPRLIHSSLARETWPGIRVCRRQINSAANPCLILPLPAYSFCS